MKKFYSRLCEDIRQRKNLELYVVLIIIFVVIIADVFGINTTEALVEIVLAVLGILLYGLIGTRHENEENYEQLSDLKQTIQKNSFSSKGFFTREHPENLKESMELANEIWIIGVSLGRTIKNNYELLETKLKEGCLIRVMLVHPKGAALKIAVSRHYTRTVKTRKGSDIEGTLEFLCDLQKIGEGRLEVRTIKFPITYGAFAINPNSPSNGRICIENYPYRVTSNGIPKFEIFSSDKEWFNFYKEELNLLWDDATNWNCKDLTIDES